MIRCPYCGKYDNKVVDERLFDDGESIRRRRACSQCNKNFTTFEKVDEIPLFVLKKDARKQFFDRNKILEGLIRSGEKGPISMQTYQNIVDELERELRSADDHEITSDLIGMKILEKLLPIDEVAYVRYASVFYRYRDIEDFKKVLEKVISLRNKG